MADKKVTEFTGTTTPAQGTDVLPIIQTADLATGTAKKTTLDALKSYITEDTMVLMLAGIFN